MTRLALTNAGLRHNEIELAISENLDLKNWNNNESGMSDCPDCADLARTRDSGTTTLYYPFPVPEMALLSIINFCNS